jgi:hypothetical protein
MMSAAVPCIARVDRGALGRLLELLLLRPVDTVGA